VVEGNNLAVALEELKAILISPIKASYREDKERDETEVGSDVKITGSNTAGSHVENIGSDSVPVPSDADTAVPDEDIPVQFTKVMGKGRLWKEVKKHAAS
jgi:hypothetical protein